jgi:hypothetical protein
MTSGQGGESSRADSFSDCAGTDYLLKIRECASRFRMREDRLRAAVNASEVPAFHAGTQRGLMVDVRDVARWIRANRYHPPAPSGDTRRRAQELVEEHNPPSDASGEGVSS